MKKCLYLVCLAAGLMLSAAADAQVLKKFKDKVNKAVEKSLDKEAEKKTGIPSETSQSGNDNSNNNNNSGKPTNKGGGGLTNTEPPDVKAQMAEAETAHGSKNYSDARYSLQQAIMGVEIQLGRQVLKSLPATVVSIAADTTKDKVMSTQWGWNNLTIQRVYRKDDKQLTITIGNNSVYSGFVNMYFANAATVEANSEKQNIKQVRVKGNKAIIQYDDSKGYTLMMQMGQTSLIVWECINFANEQEVMTAANSFDIDGIKKMMGEQ
jgi:hypothetical protein